jgi:hypothetical protein
MKALVIIPIAVLFLAVSGYGVCVAMNVNPHATELLIASGASLLASVIALFPLALTRGATQAGVAQAALLCTVVHLFGHVTAAAIVLVGKLPLHSSFAYWIMAQYWITLMALSFVLVRVVRHAPVAIGGPSTKPQ